MKYFLAIFLFISLGANAQTNNVIQKFQTGGTYIDAHITDNGTTETHTIPIMSSAPGGPSYQSNYSGTSTTFWTSYLNYGLMSINRNPITGAYGNVNLTSMEFRLSAANGAGGAYIFGTNTNNAAPSLLWAIDGAGLATFYGNAKFSANGTPAVGKIPTGTDAAGNWTWQTPSSTNVNIYNTDGTLTGDRVLTNSNHNLTFSGYGQTRWLSGTGNSTYDVSVVSDIMHIGWIRASDGAEIKGPAIQIDSNNNVVVGGGIGSATYLQTTADFATSGWNLVNSGTASTIPQGYTNTLLDFNVAVAAYNIKLPASPIDGQIESIYIGGVIASGANVITALTVSANTGQTLVQDVTPSTGKSGNIFRYKYYSTSKRWYKD